MNTSNGMRLLLNSTLLASALFGPFPATLFLMAFGFLYYPRYVEPVVAALLIELLYRGSGGSMLGAPMVFTLFVFGVFMAVESLRMFVRTRTW